MADTIYEAIVEFKELGLLAVNLEIDSLVTAMNEVMDMTSRASKAMSVFARQAASAISAAVQAPGRMMGALGKQLTELSRNPLLRGARTGALAVTAGIGGMFAGAAAGSEELSALGMAFKELAKVVGAGFAPYVRMATQAIVELTSYISSMGKDLTDAIAKWSMIGAAIAGAIAVIPTVLGMLGGIATAIAALMSPLGLVVAGVAAVVAAFSGWFNFMGEGAADAGQDVQNANKGWIDSLMSWIKTLSNNFAKFWNNVMEWASKAATFVRDTWLDLQNGIAFIMAKTGEGIGLLPEGTAKALTEDIANELKARKPVKLDGAMIDLDGLDKGLERAEAKARGMVGDVAAAFARIKAGVADDGFTNKTQSKMIGFGGDSWKQLQLAVANDPGQELQRQQLDAVREIAKWTPMIVTAVDNLRGKLWGGK